MIKKFIKITAAACAALICITAAGCANTSWIVKVGNVSVPSGVYITYLLGTVSQAEEETASSSSSSSSTGYSLNSTTSSSSSKNASSSSSSDVWSQKIDGQNVYSWTINQSLQSCKTLAIVESLCAKKNLKLSSSESSVVSQYASSYYQNTIYKNNGISQSSLTRVLQNNYLQSKLFDSYYGKSGQYAVSDSDLKNYYAKNFVHIKQIFFSKYDDENQVLSNDKLNAKKSLADSALSQAQANKSDFDALVKQYNEDPGMTQTPDGYIFGKSNSYIKTFSDTSFSMNVGDVKLIESDYGWHILYKVPVDPNASTFETNREEALSNMKSSDFKKLLNDAIKKAKVSTNQSAINRYDPKKLKGSTSTT